MRAARRAGTQVAISTISDSRPTIAAKVAGSVTSIPNSRLCMKRVNTSAPASPAATPSAAMVRPVRRTIPDTRSGVAPSAMRMPISRVPWLTR